MNNIEYQWIVSDYEEGTRKMTSFYDLVRAKIENMSKKKDDDYESEGYRAELETLKLFAEKSYLRDNYIEGMKNAIKFLEDIK